jgi:hypothetical protein
MEGYIQMKQIVGFEVEYSEHVKDWGLKLRYIFSEAPGVLQVKYKRFKDLMSLFSYIITLSGRDDDGNDSG